MNGSPSEVSTTCADQWNGTSTLPKRSSVQGEELLEALRGVLLGARLVVLPADHEQPRRGVAPEIVIRVGRVPEEPAERGALRLHTEHVRSVVREIRLEPEPVERRVGRHEHVPGANDGPVLRDHAAGLAILDVENARVLVDDSALCEDLLAERKEVLAHVKFGLVLEANAGHGRERQRHLAAHGHIQPSLLRRFVLRVQPFEVVLALGVKPARQTAEAACDAELVDEPGDAVDCGAAGAGRERRAILAEVLLERGEPRVDRLGEMRRGGARDALRHLARLEDRNAVTRAREQYTGSDAGDPGADDRDIHVEVGREPRMLGIRRGLDPEGANAIGKDGVGHAR